MDKVQKQTVLNCIVDFRRMKLGTRTRGSRRIGICPRCNSKGEMAVQPDGGVVFTHSGVNAIMFLMCAYRHYIKRDEIKKGIL